MSDKVVVAAEGLGKAYLATTSGWGRLATLLGLRPPVQRWVFRDVSFTLERGEAVGIIGANGAGKSTLLKVLTGTTTASAGRLTTHGKISALLELGMGFHGDFTGRQNVYFAGQLQNLSRAQIDAVIDWVQDFSEIGDYFDQPVRHYSSGMFVRLAFAVATAYRPELLIIDEALAVGDLYFQHKSFARIRAFHEAGTSLLFVSHDALSIKSLCNRALLLGDGRLLADDAADRVLDYYSARVAEKENRGALTEARDFAGRSGTGEVRVTQVELRVRGQASDILRSGDAVTLRVSYQVHQPVADLNLGFLLKDRTGYDVFGTNTASLGLALTASAPGQAAVDFHFPRLTLAPGSYSLTLALHSHMDHLENNYDWWERALVLRVLPNHRLPRSVGVMTLDISAESCDPASP